MMMEFLKNTENRPEEPAGTDVSNSRPGRDSGAKSFPHFFKTMGCQLVNFWSLGRKRLRLFLNVKSN